MPFELTEFVITIGFLGLLLIVFAENGLFFGFFLPGDSLLVTAGLLATQGIFSITTLLIAVPLAAILGVFVGYWFGGYVGPKVFKYKKSVLFNPKHITNAHKFYKRHGNITIVLARFVPIIRTFVPIVAGVAKMAWKDLVIYNILGGVLWTWSMLLLGYFLGRSIPNVERYIIPIIGIIVFLSLLPPLYEHYRNKK
jgi:membrane-associated protein